MLVFVNRAIQMFSFWQTTIRSILRNTSTSIYSLIPSQLRQLRCSVTKFYPLVNSASVYLESVELSTWALSFPLSYRACCEFDLSRRWCPAGALHDSARHSGHRGRHPGTVAAPRRGIVRLSPELSIAAFSGEHKNCGASFPRKKTRVNQRRRQPSFGCRSRRELYGQGRGNKTND